MYFSCSLLMRLYAFVCLFVCFCLDILHKFIHAIRVSNIYYSGYNFITVYSIYLFTLKSLTVIMISFSSLHISSFGKKPSCVIGPRTWGKAKSFMQLNTHFEFYMFKGPWYMWGFDCLPMMSYLPILVTNWIYLRQ